MERVGWSQSEGVFSSGSLSLNTDSSFSSLALLEIARNDRRLNVVFKWFFILKKNVGKGFF